MEGLAAADRLLPHTRGGISRGRILAVSLFDGIGGMRRALDVLGVELCGHISSEISPEAIKIAQHSWLETWAVGDVTAIDDSIVYKAARRYDRADIVLIGGGAPCQGVSGLNSGRLHLDDSRSALSLPGQLSMTGKKMSHLWIKQTQTYILRHMAPYLCTSAAAS